MMRYPLLWMILGFVLWSLLFLFLYGMQATGCHLGWDRLQSVGGFSPLRIAMILALCIAIAGSLFAYVRTGKTDASTAVHPTETFFREVGSYVWLAACAAVPLCFAGVAWLSLCGT